MGGYLTLTAIPNIYCQSYAYYCLTVKKQSEMPFDVKYEAMEIFHGVLLLREIKQYK